MKVPAWALAIFILGLLGIIMINLFGNITVTDQLNYTTMKNTVEASMHDSINIGYYSTGFCLCTNLSKVSNKWKFQNASDYDLVDITYDIDGKEKCVSSKANCEILRGEYRIDKKMFAESLVRRFAEMVNNNKDYEIWIQDIIEYPPKVSIRVTSKDTEFSPTDHSNDEYTIVNQIDAIIEAKNVEVETTSSNPDVAQQLSMAPPTAEKCYYNRSNWMYCWGTQSSCGFGYEPELSVPTKEKCSNKCFCQKDGDKCGVWADRPDDPAWANYTYADLVDGVCKKKDNKLCKWYAQSLQAYCTNNKSIKCNVKAGPYGDEKVARTANGALLAAAQRMCKCDDPKAQIRSVGNVRTYQSC